METIQITLNGRLISNGINLFVINAGYGLIVVDEVTRGNALTTGALEAVALTAVNRLPAP